MGGDLRIWHLFGGSWLVVGVGFIATSLGVNLFSDPAALNNGTTFWVFFTAGLVASTAGGTIIYIARMAAAHDRRLMQVGIQRTGMVTDIRRSRIDINRQVRWHVVYRYEDASGRTLHGESRALTSEVITDFKPGDWVTIKVDPQWPEDSLFLGAG